jgi:hypothetical protein
VFLAGLMVPVSPSRAGTPEADRPPLRAILEEVLASTRLLQDLNAQDGWVLAIVERQVKAGEIGWALETALTIRQQFRRAEAHKAIADAQVRGHDLPAALQTAAGDVNVLRFIAQKQLAEGNLGAALAIARAMDEGAHASRSGLMLDIVQAHARRGEIADALRVSADIGDKFGMKDRASEATALAQAEVGEFEAAAQTSSQISNANRHDRMHDIAGILARKRSTAEALHFAIVHVRTPDLSPQNLFIAVYSGKGSEIVTVMEHRTLLNRAAVEAKAGDVPAALRTIAPLEDEKGEETYHLRGALIAIARGRAKAGDIAAATELASHLSPARVPEALVEEIALAHVERGDDEVAFRSAAAILRTDYRNITLARMARRQAELGRTAKALDTAKAIMDVVRRCSVIREGILEFQAKAKDWAGLSHTSRLSPECGPDPGYALREIAGSQLRAGDTDGALRTAQSMPEWSRFRDQVLLDIAIVQVEMGRASEALSVTLPLRKKDLWILFSGALPQIARAMARTGDVEGARQLITQNMSPRDRLIMLLSIADGLTERGVGKP